MKSGGTIRKIYPRIPSSIPMQSFQTHGRIWDSKLIHNNLNSETQAGVISMMKLRNPHRLIGSVTLLLLIVLCALCDLGFCEYDGFIRMKPAIVGGIRDVRGTQNSAEIESIGRFAVDEHNKKENALLEFARVVKAKEQVVAGKMYHLTLEAIDAGRRQIYEAKVWVKPWLNFKQLQEFKHTCDGHSYVSADVSVNQDGPEQGWRSVPTYDPVVKGAAYHAVKTIQWRSNSLSPYELLEILLAKVKAIENYTKFDMLLKVKRGTKEEKFKVIVSKSIEGKFFVNHMVEDHP